MPKENISLLLAHPPIESLLSFRYRKLWPQKISRSRALSQLADERLLLNQTLALVFDQIHNLELTEAIDAGAVSEEDVMLALQKLAEFLETDSLHKRLVLYLPFELLPHTLWQHRSTALCEAIMQFSNIYLKRWETLLTVADVRANFVDGDVVEPELRTGPVPRVAKAAHFIPVLAAKGLISVQRVLELLEYPESVLGQSIMDTFPMLADLGLMSREKAAALTKYHAKRTAPPPSVITPERAQWLKLEEEKRSVENIAKDISCEILTDISLSLARLGKIHCADTQAMLAIIYGIRMATENVACRNIDDAKWLYAEHDHILMYLWEKSIPDVQDALISTWSRLLHLGVLDEEDVERLGVFIPDLEAGFTKNQKLIERDAEALTPALEHMCLDPELARLFYPICILYGSRVKGYGTLTADLDVAVFVRPEISFEERPAVQEQLEELFAHEKVRGKVLEFWLEQKGEELAIRDFPRPDTRLGDSALVHVLFGGMWYGAEQAIHELFEKVLSGYLYEKDDEKRRVWLEELERDALLYRLLHKGYTRLYPEAGWLRTPHADWIDGKSLFYDSGYRRLATKLFLKKVFLPKLG